MEVRNNFVFRQQKPYKSWVVSLASAAMRTAQLSHTNVRGSGDHRLTPDALWRPPDPGVTKVNIDGAFKSKSNEGTMACICRNHNGKLLDGLIRSFLTSLAMQAEFLSLTITLRYLLERSKVDDRLEIESNSQVLVETIQLSRSPPWEVRSLFVEATALFQRFSHLCIRFCRRGANFVADWAAKALRNGILSLNWPVLPPSTMLDILYSDTLNAGCNLTFYE